MEHMNTTGGKYVMNNPKSVAEALAALPSSTSNRTKAGRLRELLPQIEAVHAAGVPHQTIVETLNEQGFDLTLKTYKAMLHRARKELAASGKKAGAPSAPAAAAKAATPADLTPKNDKGGAPSPSSSQGASAPRRPGEPDKFVWDVDKNETPEW